MNDEGIVILAALTFAGLRAGCTCISYVANDIRTEKQNIKDIENQTGETIENLVKKHPGCEYTYKTIEDDIYYVGFVKKGETRDQDSFVAGYILKDLKRLKPTVEEIEKPIEENKGPRDHSYNKKGYSNIPKKTIKPGKK